MDCIVIDDERTALEILGGLCQAHHDLNLMGTFLQPMEGLKFLNKNHADLIFLDIHMPGFSGIDFLETISNNDCKVILTTSDSNFALEAFEYSCVADYLLKPIESERFDKAVSKASAQLGNQVKGSDSEQVKSDSHLFVNINKRLIKINLEDIYYVEAKGDYVSVVTKDKTYVVHTSLKSIQTKLPETLFFKSHRSFIVNLDEIQEIEENTLVINRHLIPVSKNSKQALIKKLNLL